MTSFDRVYWLSGSPCGGKTTVSNVLAKRYDWNVYHVDEHWDNHKERATAENHPTYIAITRVTGDELWLRPLDEQIRTEPIFVKEAFPLILEDIEQLLAKDTRPLIVDASVVPSSVQSILPSKNHIFYLIPSEHFQREQYALRPSIKHTLAKTSDVELAWSNWMARDAAYARWLEVQVKAADLDYLKVSGAMSLTDTVNMIADHYLSETG
jgi:hypothetical protein